MFSRLSGKGKKKEGTREKSEATAPTAGSTDSELEENTVPARMQPPTRPPPVSPRSNADLQSGMRDLMTENEKWKAEAKKAEAERIRALATAVALQGSLKESEEQLATLRTGFISLDEKHVALLREHEEQQKTLCASTDRLAALEAEKQELLQRAISSEETGNLRDSSGTTTSQADSAVEEADRALNSARPPTELVDSQKLRSDNDRLKAELEDLRSQLEDMAKAAQAKTDELEMAKSLEISRLESATVLAQDVATAKDAELERAISAARENDAKAAAEVRRLQDELTRAHADKKIVEQAMERLPLDSQRQHEDEVNQLRIELEASRRNELELTMELRVQKALDEARRREQENSSCGAPSATAKEGDDGIWPSTDEETQQLQETPRAVRVSQAPKSEQALESAKQKELVQKLLADLEAERDRSSRAQRELEKAQQRASPSSAGRSGAKQRRAKEAIGTKESQLPAVSDSSDDEDDNSAAKTDLTLQAAPAVDHRDVQKVDHLQQVGQRLKEVLDTEMRNRGLTGLDIDFQWGDGGQGPSLIFNESTVAEEGSRTFITRTPVGTPSVPTPAVESPTTKASPSGRSGLKHVGRKKAGEKHASPLDAEAFSRGKSRLAGAAVSIINCGAESRNESGDVRDSKILALERALARESSIHHAVGTEHGDEGDADVDDGECDTSEQQWQIVREEDVSDELDAEQQEGSLSEAPSSSSPFSRSATNSHRRKSSKGNSSISRVALNLPSKDGDGGREARKISMYSTTDTIQSMTSDPAGKYSEQEWEEKCHPTSELRRVKWANLGLDKEASILFAALRKKWGSVKDGFNSMVQLKNTNGAAPCTYERADYGSFVEKEITSHITKRTIGKHDWLVAVEATCIEANISHQTASAVFDGMDVHNIGEITYNQLYAGYKGAGALSCGGGGVPLSMKLKGKNKKKGRKLTRFHHVPSAAVKIPEHRCRKVRSLGELLDWHGRVCPSTAATFQGIGEHNGRGWEISNTDMSFKGNHVMIDGTYKDITSTPPIVTPRTHSHCTTPRSAAAATPRSRLATPRNHDETSSASLLPGHGTRFSAPFLPPHQISLYPEAETHDGSTKTGNSTKTTESKVEEKADTFPRNKENKAANARRSATHMSYSTPTLELKSSNKQGPGRFDEGYFHNVPKNIQPPPHKKISGECSAISWSALMFSAFHGAQRRALSSTKSCATQLVHKGR